MAFANAILEGAPADLACLTLASSRRADSKSELHAPRKEQPGEDFDALIRALPAENVLPGVPL